MEAVPLLKNNLLMKIDFWGETEKFFSAVHFYMNYRIMNYTYRVAIVLVP